MNKISTIIPIYNSENYLQACLESVLRQTYQNLEIILVNDGSTDSSPKICDDYALKDNRIKVIHQKNAGVCVARNVGLKIATGNFISFVDNDDLISVSFFSRLIQIAIENNADIVECGFSKFETPLELEKTIRPLNEITEIFNTENALELLMQEYFKQIVWNKIYRKEVIMDIIFPQDKTSDDEYWTYKVFGNSKIIIKISDILYFYRQHSTSQMAKSYGQQRLDGLGALEVRILYMKENFPNLESLAIKIFCLASLWHYQKIDKHLEFDPEGIYRRKILNNAKAYNKLSIFKHWKLKEIFWYKIFIIAPKFCVKFRNLIKVGI